MAATPPTPSGYREREVVCDTTISKASLSAADELTAIRMGEPGYR